MTGDVRSAARVALGHALLAAARHLTRRGAHLIGHPSTRTRPPLRIVRTETVRAVAVDPAVEEWFHGGPRSCS